MIPEYFSTRARGNRNPVSVFSLDSYDGKTRPRSNDNKTTGQSSVAEMQRRKSVRKKRMQESYKHEYNDGMSVCLGKAFLRNEQTCFEEYMSRAK